MIRSAMGSCHGSPLMNQPQICREENAQTAHAVRFRQHDALNMGDSVENDPRCKQPIFHCEDDGAFPLRMRTRRIQIFESISILRDMVLLHHLLV